jgi:hypothetical protein
MYPISNSIIENSAPISRSEIGQEHLHPPPHGKIDQGEGKDLDKKRGKVERTFFPAFLLLASLSFLSCSSKPQTGILFRDLAGPPPVVQQAFAKEGKSDYFLFLDEGYSFRLIYLCENRVLNFIEEPPQNPVLVSIQPILDTPVEKRLSPDDRRRVWACMERKVWEEKSRIDELKSRIYRKRMQTEEEISLAGAERGRIVAEIAEKKRLEMERQLKIEREKKRTEEERLRKLAEKNRRYAEEERSAEEERKIKYYKSGEKQDRPSIPPPPSPQITESGIFLIMKEAAVREEPRETSKVQARAEKYDLFEVVNSKKGEFGNQWYQILLGERMISDRGKRFGWSPEEKSFWQKNRLLVWVYPGDINNINKIKPLKIRIDDVQFTGKMGRTPQERFFYEVSYLVNTTSREEILGWVEEGDGIRRSTKTKEEMRNLLKDLSKTLWPIRIQEDILRGYIRQGFTREQVVLSWGRPDHVNTTRTLVGVHEQWVYGEPPFPKSYVYFENGIVKSWEFLKNDAR